MPGQTKGLYSLSYSATPGDMAVASVNEGVDRAQPLSEGRGDDLRLLHRRHVSAALHDHECRRRDPAGHLLVTGRRAPGILRAAKNERRARDVRQQLRRVGPREQRALLCLEDGRCLTLDHPHHRLHQGLVVKPVGMDHAANPLLSHRAHSAAPRELDQLQALGPLALPDVVGRSSLVPGVEQGEPAYALARLSVSFERHAAAHRMPDDHQVARCPVKDVAAIADSESRAP